MKQINLYDYGYKIQELINNLTPNNFLLLWNYLKQKGYDFNSICFYEDSETNNIGIELII